MAIKRERDIQHARYAWLTLAQAGDELGGASPMQVRRWIEDGDLQAFDASRSGSKRRVFRIAPEWIKAFSERRTLNGAPVQTKKKER